MGNLSTYRSSGAPVGSITMFHKSVSSSLIVDRGQEYLRTGEFVPYQAKYSVAASRGLKLDGNGSVFNPGSLVTSFKENDTVTSWLTYAKGALHMMHQTVSDAVAASGEEVVFLIAKISGDTLESPEVVVTPSMESLDISRLGAGQSFRYVSQPFYVTGCNQWACVLASGNITVGNMVTFTFYVATSLDGVSWRLAGSLGAYNFGASNTLNGFRITAASIGNQINYAASLNNPSGAHAIVTGSGNLDSGANITGITRTPTSYRSFSTAAAYSSSGNMFAAPISPKGLYFYHVDAGGLTSLRIIDDSALDMSATAVGTPDLSADNSTNTGPRGLISSNGIAVFAYLFDGPKDNNAITIADITDLKTFTVHNFASDTTTGTPSYAYPSGNNFLFALPLAGTATQCYSITPAGSVTTLTSALADQVITIGTGNRTFDNHVYLQMAGTDRVVNIANNTITDFTLAAGTSDLGDQLTDVISADGTNILLAYGGPTNSAAGAIAKVSTSNFNVRSLKYVDSATNGPCRSSGVFRRLADASQTIVFISRNSNQFLSSTNNGDTWSVQTVTGVASVQDIEYISGRFVVVGNTTGSTNFAHGTTMGSWTNGVIGSTAINCRQLFNTGTSLIVVNSSTNAYRSTNGTSWTVQSGTTVNTTSGASFAKNGGTIHVYVPNAPAGKVNRQQSTDDGVTWSTVSTVPSLALNATGQVPGKFVFSNNKWYCLPVNTTTNQTDLEIYETSDLINFSRVPTIVNTMNTPGYYGSLALNNGRVYALASTGTANLNNFGKGLMVYKINGAVPGYIGTVESVVEGNQLGYVRIK